jgi:hypothetical protein
MVTMPMSAFGAAEVRKPREASRGRCWFSPASGVRRSCDGFPKVAGGRREPREPNERSRLSLKGEIGIRGDRLAARIRLTHSGRDERESRVRSFERRAPARSSRAPRCHRIARADAWIQSAVCDPTKTHRERVPPRRGDAASNGSRCFSSEDSLRACGTNPAALDCELEDVLDPCETKTNPRAPFQPLGSIVCPCEGENDELTTRLDDEWEEARRAKRL